MRTARLFLAMLFLSGCAALGLPQADTFNERLAMAYAANTAVRTMATTLLNANKITAQDGQNVLQATDNARTGLDIARTLSKTNLQAADGKLTAVRTVLAALQAYLVSRGG